MVRRAGPPDAGTRVLQRARGRRRGGRSPHDRAARRAHRRGAHRPAHAPESMATDVVDVLAAYRPDLRWPACRAPRSILGRTTLVAPLIPKPFNAESLRGLLQPLIVRAAATCGSRRRPNAFRPPTRSVSPRSSRRRSDAARAEAIDLVEAALVLRQQRAGARPPQLDFRPRERGGTGRRAGLRILSRKGAGSTPAVRTPSFRFHITRSAITRRRRVSREVAMVSRGRFRL